MSRPRKTIAVADVVSYLNAKIEQAPTPEAREVLAHVAERVLHDTNTYRGFGYTNLVRTVDSYGDESYDSPDETQRHYYLPAS